VALTVHGPATAGGSAGTGECLAGTQVGLSHMSRRRIGPSGRWRRCPGSVG